MIRALLDPAGAIVDEYSAAQDAQGNPTALRDHR
jgi:hypothetical protein